MKNNIITEFINGQSCRAYEALGAVKIENGIRFSTYAPHARKVELCLNGDIIPMECDERGVWSVERPAKRVTFISMLSQRLLLKSTTAQTLLRCTAR